MRNSLRDVKQCAKIPRSVTGRASIQTQVSFIPKPFVKLPRPGHSSLEIFPSGSVLSAQIPGRDNSRGVWGLGGGSAIRACDPTDLEGPAYLALGGLVLPSRLEAAGSS